MSLQYNTLPVHLHWCIIGGGLVACECFYFDCCAADSKVVCADAWKSRWVESKHKSDYGKFVLTAGRFYGDAEKDKGEWKGYVLPIHGVSGQDGPLILVLSIKPMGDYVVFDCSWFLGDSLRFRIDWHFTIIWYFFRIDFWWSSLGFTRIFQIF